MKMLEIREKKEYEQGEMAFSEREFVQSWEFGEFLRSVGRDVRRYGFEMDGLKYTMQGICQRHPFGTSYLYMPRVDLPSDSIAALCTALKHIGYTFVRIEPLQGCQVEAYRSFETYNRQPEHTWLLDVTASEETLLAEMHAKTRYNIRLAEKKGVVVKEESSASIFWELNQVTVERDGFKNHDRAYFDTLLQLPNTKQLVAWYQDIPIASIILFWHGSTMYYFYGASSNEHRNVMAPYLLQWQGIRFAKERGCERYDFWGIAEPVAGPERDGVQCLHDLCWNATQPLSGVTRFKAGFGGYARSYPKAMDVVLDPLKYGIYKVMRGVFRR